MSHATSPSMGRRTFLASSSFVLLGAGCFEAFQLTSQAPPRGADLKEELTPAEAELVNNSAMARDVNNFFEKGYSCAETGLVVGLRFLKKPEELVWAAGGFGGGLGHKDLCGFLTGGFMAVGLYAGMQGLDRKAAKQLCSQKAQAYWTWWASAAPLHCADIREGRTDFKVCHRLGKLAAVELERLMTAQA